MEETSTMLRGRAEEGTYLRKGSKEKLPAETLSWGVRDEKKAAMEKMEEEISSQRSRSKKNSTLFRETMRNPRGYKRCSSCSCLLLHRLYHSSQAPWNQSCLEPLNYSSSSFLLKKGWLNHDLKLVTNRRNVSWSVVLCFSVMKSLKYRNNTRKLSNECKCICMCLCNHPP